MRQFAVIGLGRFGFSVAKTLCKKGAKVLAIDIDENKVQDIAEFVEHAVSIDATDEKALKSVGINNAEVVIVSIRDLEPSILVTLALKEMGIKDIIAKAVSESHGKVLEKVGATKVVFPERDMGVRLANILISPFVIDHIDLSHDSSIVEIIPPPDFVGKTLKDINVRTQYGINIIAIKKRSALKKKTELQNVDELINVAPKADDIIKQDDILVVFGKNEEIEKIKQKNG